MDAQDAVQLNARHWIINNHCDLSELNGVERSPCCKNVSDIDRKRRGKSFLKQMGKFSYNLIRKYTYRHIHVVFPV